MQPRLPLQAKKLRELHHLRRFLELRPDLGADHVECSEAPDFLLSGEEGRVIGVEVAELYHPSASDGASLQAQESLRGRAARAAQRVFEALVPARPSLHVSIHFSSVNRLTKRGVVSVAPAIACAVDDHIPPPDGRCMVRSEWAIEGELPDEVCALNIYHFANHHRTAWATPGGTYVPALEYALVAQYLEKKDRRLALYRKQCDEAWLLLVASDSHLAGMFRIDQHQLDLVGRASFDRVFLLHEHRQVYELGQ
jgi:hypothetical protein